MVLFYFFNTQIPRVLFILVSQAPLSSNFQELASKKKERKQLNLFYLHYDNNLQSIIMSEDFSFFFPLRVLTSFLLNHPQIDKYHVLFRLKRKALRIQSPSNHSSYTTDSLVL